MRPATYEPQQIIEAGQVLQAEGRNITGFALRNKVGGGNPGRLKQIWDEYLSSQTEVTAEPVAELPVEVAEEVKAVSSALAERISQLATELNDKAVRAAERRVSEITRAAGEQTAQAERELADAAQTVDDLEERLDELRGEYTTTLAERDEGREKVQAQAIELAQLRERLTAAEQQRSETEKAAMLAAEQHSQQLADLQKRLANAEKKLTDSIAHHAAALHEAKTQHAAETNELKTQHARIEAELQKRLDVVDKAASLTEEQHQREVQGLKERLNLAEQSATGAAEKAETTITAITAKHGMELKTRQDALDKALRDATEARETKAALAGEIKALKEQNGQLATLLAGNSGL
ncbi:alpha-helical coiled-coil protein (plasmid) [Yersinia similis]|uniref:Alpha-helical coiled-coil protein n=1 Tax=Yersinia similis TaxID=367190 RepID=A0ABM5Q494_9GAMM|nr:DNA-binding protein [Yersinia similis]AHK22062.1 alpha-helical coiled-coil protein [Yersinia similis]CFQ66770.1 Plasmid replication region DNA-binding N-term [Yersinia similis]CNB81186.1 Plasmid replication region DNA-binding N-term [Yersinia similis]